MSEEKIAETPASVSDEPLQTNSHDIHEALTAAKEDPDFLAALAMPEIFTYCWPPVFTYVWGWLLSKVSLTRDFSRLALGLPRGFGKTTLVKLFILYCILFTKRRYIIVVSATAKHANAIISDVADMLDEDNIKAVFGDWNIGKTTDTQDEKVFGFRGRNIILRGIGAGGAIRGSNKKQSRPDVMIFEDIQTREDADSLEVSDKLYNWLIGTALKSKDPRGCLNLFIANMYPTPHSILKKLKNNKYWEKVMAGGILVNSEGSLESLWEELQPLEQLLEEYASDTEAGKAEIFAAEVLNDENAALNNLVDLSRLPSYPFQEEDIPQGSFIIIDPATDKLGADAVSVGYFEMHENKPCLVELVEGSLSPSETVRYSLEIAMRRGCRLIAVESNAYQYSLLHWFGVVINQLGIDGIQVVDVYSGALTKNTRILTMLKSYAAGEILIHPRCKTATDSQVNSFNPLKRDNTDGILDLLTYTSVVISKYSHAISMMTWENQSDMDAITVVSEEVNSPF